MDSFTRKTWKLFPMNPWAQSTSVERRFILIAGAVMVLFYVLQVINGRNDLFDFQVYYGAASELIQGGEPYGKWYGLDSGIYKYSPISIWIFVPLALLPFQWAAAIYYVFVVWAILAVLVFLFRRTQHCFLSAAYHPLAMILVCVVLSDVLIRELHLGNINMILLGLFLWAIRQMETGRPHLSGWLIALGILIKPHFVILLPWLVMRGKWRVLGTSLTGVVAGLFIPAVVHGWQGNRALLEGWQQALGKHNVDLWDSPNTLFGMVNHAFLEPFGVQAGWWLPVAVILLAGGGYFLWMRHHGWKDVPLSRQYLEVMVLIGMIPLLTHTDTEHFLFSAPLLVLLAGVLFDRRLSIWLYATLFLIIGIPYYLNSPDFLGASGAAFMDNSGLLGLSCTIFLLASLFVVRFLPKRGC
ncbi:MAG: DUF2029 domain-containing protein [Flavobacteriales bacterium]|nr:DUF2029 domain-containing protein [Flavobacteriales bacterium]